MPNKYNPNASGVELIGAERQRQVIDENRTPEADANHTDGQLALAGAMYAISAHLIPPGARFADLRNTNTYAGETVQRYWPFDDYWYKPRGGVEDLVRAGALIAAEIDRLQAAANACPKCGADARWSRLSVSGKGNTTTVTRRCDSCGYKTEAPAQPQAPPKHFKEDKH